MSFNHISLDACTFYKLFEDRNFRRFTLRKRNADSIGYVKNIIDFASNKELFLQLNNTSKDLSIINSYKEKSPKFLHLYPASE